MSEKPDRLQKPVWFEKKEKFILQDIKNHTVANAIYENKS